MYTHARTHTHTHTYIYTHTHTHTHTRTRTLTLWHRAACHNKVAERAFYLTPSFGAEICERVLFRASGQRRREASSPPYQLARHWPKGKKDDKHQCPQAGGRLHVLARGAAAAGEREGIYADDIRAMHPGNLLSIDPVPVAVLNVPRPVKNTQSASSPTVWCGEQAVYYIYIYIICIQGSGRDVWHLKCLKSRQKVPLTFWRKSQLV